MARIVREAEARGRVLRRAVVDARLEAELIVERARERATQIIDEAQREVQRAVESGKAEGRLAGGAALKPLLIDAVRIRDAALKASTRDILFVALTAAEKIVGHEVNHDAQIFAKIVEDAIRRTQRARILQVRAHPDDLAHLSKSEFDSLIRVEPDSTIARGGCIVVSDLGIIDARVEVQLEALAHALAEVVGE